MIGMSKAWYQLRLKSKYEYSYTKLKAKGIYGNARKESPSLNARKFKTRIQAEKHLASLPKERKKYYEVRELFGLFL